MLGELLPFGQYVNATIILLAGLGLASFAYFLLDIFFKRALRNTSSKIDNDVLRKLKRPVSAYIALSGLYFALRQLSALTSFHSRLGDVYFTFSVLMVSYILSRIVSVLIKHHVKVHERHESTPRLFDLIISGLIFAVGIIMVLQYFNVKITAIVATLGIGGLAIGLALQDTLANLFAGLHLITAKPVRVGDYIELDDGRSGYVQDITWRSTRVRQIPNNVVIIPNRKLADSVITNDSMPEEQLSCLVECGVDYGSDLDHVEHVVLDVANAVQEEVDGALKGFEPFMRFHTFGDSNIEFSVYLRVERYYNKYFVTHEFMKRLKRRFDDEGIEISWPVRKIFNRSD